MPPPRRPPGDAPGGRSARVRSTVLQSAFAVLTEKGIDAFTVAEVAARAGVHETSIYRRWGTLTALTLDACLHFADAALAIPDTGSLRSDPVVLMHRLIALLSSPPGQAFLALRASRYPEAVAARSSYFWAAVRFGARYFRQGGIAGRIFPPHRSDAASGDLDRAALFAAPGHGGAARRLADDPDDRSLAGWLWRAMRIVRSPVASR